jgi:hypothetical protein
MAGILSVAHLAASEDCASEAIDTERTSYDARDVVYNLWESMDLPKHALKSLALEGQGLGLPSSFKAGLLAQSAIALSALTAALFHSTRTECDVPKVLVSLRHACIEFNSEKLYSIAGSNKPALWGPIGGLHKTSDGYVRIHDGFPNHRDGAKRLLGCSPNADRTGVASKVAEWKSVELENAAVEAGLPIAALRSYAEWDALPQSRAVSSTPIIIRKIADGSPYIPTGTLPDKCLRGIRVLEMSRVIAAPVAGKTLAVHGADILWVTSPNLPDLPVIDRDLARGKRTIQLDINNSRDKEILLSLAKDADVFIQGFRPGALAAKGISSSEMAKLNPNGMVIANMSAYGSSGPWSGRRGFDSLVQTCSGMNISEAQHFGDPNVAARPTPCQALDHAGGYFLAAGISAALCRRATEGGSYEVEVSLAGVMKYLRSLGQYEGDSGFQSENFEKQEDVPGEILETMESGFGMLTAVTHSARIEGVGVGWDRMPKLLGSDEAKWLHYG